MQTIRSVGVLSVAKIMGLLQACLSLVFVPFFLAIAAVGSFASPHNNPLGAFGAAGITILAILMPVFYGVFGFAAGAMGALLYNLLAKWIGGIQIDLQPPAPAIQAQPSV
jgi:hypothetical protein